MNKDSPLSKLLQTLPQYGRVEWIGLRPVRGVPIKMVSSAIAETDKGLFGDRFKGRQGNPRQVTLIQQEHLAVIAGCLDLPSIDPALLRRNIVISGINLLALKDKTFQLGGAILQTTGLCHPCSKMEAALGPGGYNRRTRPRRHYRSHPGRWRDNYRRQARIPAESGLTCRPAADTIVFPCFCRTNMVRFK